MKPPLRRLPAISAAAAFALYVATMAHVHVHDTPLYVREILSGDLVSFHHVLAKPLAAGLIAVAQAVAPSVSPYTPLCLVDAAAGAVIVGLLHALLVRKGVPEPWPTLAAALVAVTRVTWTLATTYEVGLPPVVVLLLAAHVSARPHDRPALTGAATGALQGLAMALHLGAVGAVLAWPLALRDRKAIAAYLAAAPLTVVALYASVLPLASAGKVHLSDAVAFLASPTLDERAGKPRPPAMLVHGLGDAITAQPWATSAGIAVLVVVVAVLLLAARSHRPKPASDVFRDVLPPLAWAVGGALAALAVEPGNFEYFVGPLVALAWACAVAAPPPGRRSWASLVAVPIVAATNVPIVAGAMTSPTGEHVGVVQAGRGFDLEVVDPWGRPTGAKPPRPAGPTPSRRP